jgi:hypothetical protein
MRTISAVDASIFSLIQTGGLIEEELIKEALGIIGDPILAKKAVGIHLENLKKAGVSIRKIQSVRKSYAGILQLKRKKWSRLKTEAKEKERQKKETDAKIDLAWRCMKFVDKNPKSKILDRGSNPFSAWLHMSYKGRGLSIEFKNMVSPYSNGSVWVKVMVRKRIVFEIIDEEVKTYTSGNWEQLIRK